MGCSVSHEPHHAFSERMAMYLADLPTSDIFVLAIGVILGLIVAALLGTSFFPSAHHWTVYFPHLQHPWRYCRG